MFENKATNDQTTSSPTRGRSPQETTNSERNSRSVSKVRASFIAVEKPGLPGQAPQWGLRKASDVSSISAVNGNISEDSSLGKITSRTSTTMADNGETAQDDLGHLLKGSSFDNEEAISTRQVNDATDGPSSGEPQTNAAPQETTENKTPKQDNTTSPASKMETPTSATKSKPSPAQPDASKPGQPVKTSPTRNVPAKSAEKSPISPSAPQSTKVNTTHPAPSVRGIRGGPAKIMAVMDSANKARVEREKKSPMIEKKSPNEKKSSIEKKSPTIERKSSQAVKKDVTPKTSITNGAKKEPTSSKAAKSTKPPTKLVKLPAAATARTAASVARTDGPPKKLSTDNRRVSAVRKDQPLSKATSTATASSLAKRTPRTSLAPQTNGHERPKSRVSTAKDESFLARMTRPTASSQKKVHEKVTKPDSPPRTRKVSDKIRQSLGSTKDKSEDKENEADSPLETKTSLPQAEEQTVMTAQWAPEQEETS